MLPQARKVPHWKQQPQRWAGGQMVNAHDETLYRYGEMVLFTLMWRPLDYERGLVGHCPTCYLSSRSAQAFQQPTERKCPDCFGTTFEGGFRAQIVRPALISDRNVDDLDTARGTLTTDSLQVDTTADFTLHGGDYLFRADNARYQCESMSEVVLRSGFAEPRSEESFGGTIPAAHLEDPSSVAYLIPPDAATLATTLSAATQGHLASDLTAYQTVRPNGYL